MCSTGHFYRFVHWTLMLVALLKLVLDAPSWYFVVSEQYRLIFNDGHSKDADRLLEKKSVATKLFIGMHLAILKFVVDVFMDLTLFYACYKVTVPYWDVIGELYDKVLACLKYLHKIDKKSLISVENKKNKGLLVLYSTYNAAVAAFTVYGMYRAFRDFSKSTAISAINPFSSGPKDSVVVEMYLLLVFVAPYICSSIDTLRNNVVAIFVTEMVLVHVVLPILVYYEIQMVKFYRLYNRAVLLELMKDKEENVPMNAHNSDV